MDYKNVVPWKLLKKLPRRTQKLVDDFCVGTPDGFIPPPDFNFDLLSVEWYFNHSCSGNLGFDERGDFVAGQRIASGDELTYDYGLVESGPRLKMTCNRRKNCRTKITGRDWKDPRIFDESDRKFMLPWLREQLPK